MSELRCPMCGKTNSGDQDYCQYCQARLTPLVVNPDEVGSASASGSLDAAQSDTPFDQPMDSSSDLPAWLDSLRSEDEREEGQDTLPDWLSDSGSTGSESASDGVGAGDDIPEWLSSLRGESAGDEQPLSDEVEAGIEAEQADVPDWLAGMRETSGEDLEDHVTGEEQADQFVESEPEWLQRLDSEPEPEFEDQSPPAVPLEDEHLAALGIAGDAAAQSVEPLTQEDSDEPPDWLTGLSAAALTSDAMDTAGESPVDDAPPPVAEKPLVSDVIEPVIVVGAVKAFIPDEPSSSVEEVIPEWPEDANEAGIAPDATKVELEIPASEVPDWLSGYDESTDAAESAFSPPGDTEGPLDLDWLEAERQTLNYSTEQSQPETSLVSPFEEEEVESQSFFTGDLPEWLGDDAEKAALAEAAPVPGEQGENLAQSDLPSWLESMRPIESAALAAPFVETSDKQVEGTGPLAGLRSVLPSEFELGARSMPAAYTVKLQVSDTQKTHASIIDELIKSEGEAKELPKRRALGSQQILLIGIAVILVLALLWPLLSGGQSVELPYFSNEVFEASNAIGNLPAGVPVLLAVDYEPGMSGEMEATASAVMDHLMLKGAFLTLVSTLPSGPAQAERLVQGANARGGHTYQNDEMYANLGYLPGGTVGIRSFAESPRQVMPFALDGADVWNTDPLINAQKLSDFAMLLVFTDSSYTARSWIEQAKPLLGDRALITVVSAQTEPVVRPYFEGEPRMVQGIVAGLPGGATYESMIGRASLARNYWDAYSIGVSLIVVLLVVGGVVSIILHFTSERKQSLGGVKR